jgi:ATP-binding cassette, subfamily G (WHITE), member 2, SNQ2
MIDVVSGTLSTDRDWPMVWLNSPEYAKSIKELDQIIANAANSPPGTMDDGHEFAQDMWTQVKLVTNRMNVALFRNTEYVYNKLMLHVASALLNGCKSQHSPYLPGH